MDSDLRSPVGVVGWDGNSTRHLPCDLLVALCLEAKVAGRKQKTFNNIDHLLLVHIAPPDIRSPKAAQAFRLKDPAGPRQTREAHHRVVSSQDAVKFDSFAASSGGQSPGAAFVTT